MKVRFLFALLLSDLTAHAANPAFGDFNANQFGTSGNKVVAKDGIQLTNPVVSSGTLTAPRIVGSGGLGATNLLTGKIQSTNLNSANTYVEFNGPQLTWGGPMIQVVSTNASEFKVTTAGDVSWRGAATGDGSGITNVSASAITSQVVTQNNAFSFVSSNAIRIDAAHSLSLSNITTGKVLVSATDGTVTNSGLGSVSINGDGTATTAGQLFTAMGGVVATNNGNNQFSTAQTVNGGLTNTGYSSTTTNYSTKIRVGGAAETADAVNVTGTIAVSSTAAFGANMTVNDIIGNAVSGSSGSRIRFAATSAVIGRSDGAFAVTMNFATSGQKPTGSITVPGSLYVDGNLLFTTNSESSVSADMARGFGYITTNAAFLYLSPANVDTGKTLFQSHVSFVTNSTAAAVNITFAASVHVTGTANVTNLTRVDWEISPWWTNAICSPRF